MSRGASSAMPTRRYHHDHDDGAVPVILGGLRAAPPITLSEHVLGHLTPAQQRVATTLARPVTVTEAAGELRMTRRATEYHWHQLRAALGLPGAAAGTTGASRVALVRVLMGIDPCYCGARR